MSASLTWDRKGVRCDGCHRVIALRTRMSDGTHRLYLDPDWHLVGDHLQRNWARLEAGQSARRHSEGPTRPGWKPALLPVRRRGPGAGTVVPVQCGCGELIALDDPTLDVVIDRGGPPTSRPDPIAD